MPTSILLVDFCKKDSDPDTADCLVQGSLQKDHQYYYQVQAQMFVCSVGYADFVVCTFPNDVPTITIERISIDVDFLVESNLLSKPGTFTTWPYYQNCWQNGIPVAL